MTHDFYDELRDCLHNSRSMTDDEISSNYPNLNISFVFDETAFTFLPSINYGESDEYSDCSITLNNDNSLSVLFEMKDASTIELKIDSDNNVLMESYSKDDTVSKITFTDTFVDNFSFIDLSKNNIDLINEPNIDSYSYKSGDTETDFHKEYFSSKGILSSNDKESYQYIEFDKDGYKVFSYTFDFNNIEEKIETEQADYAVRDTIVNCDSYIVLNTNDEKTLEHFAKNDDPRIFTLVIANSNTPENILDDIASRPQTNAQNISNILHHNNCSTSIVNNIAERLFNDLESNYKPDSNEAYPNIREVASRLEPTLLESYKERMGSVSNNFHNEKIDFIKGVLENPNTTTNDILDIIKDNISDIGEILENVGLPNNDPEQNTEIGQVLYDVLIDNSDNINEYQLESAIFSVYKNYKNEDCKEYILEKFDSVIEKNEYNGIDYIDTDHLATIIVNCSDSKELNRLEKIVSNIDFNNFITENSSDFDTIIDELFDAIEKTKLELTTDEMISQEDIIKDNIDTDEKSFKFGDWRDIDINEIDDSYYDSSSSDWTD